MLRRITSASLTESHPHDLFITNAGNSYPIDGGRGPAA